MTAERKTINASTGESPNKQPAGNQPPGTNVLHTYRSVNYLFTFAALTTDEVNDPATYRGKALNCIILKSGGKGTKGMTPPSKLSSNQVEALAKEVEEPVYDKYSAQNNKRNLDAATLKATSDNKSLVAEFNEKSPGRFDMFIDNLEIETVMARDQNSASTQPTKISFDVFEPYSINGFIEALQVASQASGHPTYAKAAFVLKMEFIGYPDLGDMPDPTIEKYGTRYFPLAITGVDVNVDERGTKYNVKAVPVNEVHFGNPSSLKKPVKVQGQTVKEILTDLVKSLSEQVKKEGEDSKEKPAGYDEYKVKFPTWVDGKGWDDSAENSIASCKVTEITEDKNLFNMPDPGNGSSNAEESTVYSPEGVPMYTSPAPASGAVSKSGKRLVPNEPRNPVVQFNEGRSVQECMEAIIRDSHYLRERLEKLMGKNWQEVVKENMFDYFLIKLETTEKPEIDKIKNKHYFIYTYVVTPYKILFTKVPGFANETVDQSLLYQSCVRKYDYIYSGKNLDITNFKLNFNNLFFEAIPTGMGNVQGQPGREAVSKTDGTDAKKIEDNKDSTTKGGPASGAQSDPALTNTMSRSGGQTQQSPYYAMAQALHNSIVNSKASMITGEIDILGDPIYLVTGGLGSNNPKPSDGSPRVSEDGEASFNYGDVLININFRNPIDIGEDGFYKFDPNLIPFSGVYQVTTCKSTFKDGQFRQSLNIIRMPGQAIPVANPDTTPQSQQTPKTNPADSNTESPDPDDVAGQDTAPVSAETAGTRPGVFNLLSQLNRTIPSPGLPGQLSNFTAATGGAGTTVNIPSGVNPNLPAVSRMISPLGITQQPAFGMPLPARAAVGLQQRVYSPGGYVQQAGMGLLKSFGVSGPFAQLAGQYLGNVGRKINSIPVLGSGIGVGASINIVKNNSNPQTTADYNNQQLPDQPTATPTLSGISGTALGYLGNNMTAIPGMTNNAALRVQAATQGNTADPLAIAAAYGISQAQLSGLSPNITSNIIGQLENLVKKTPKDTDLNTAVQNGVNLNGLTQNEVASLPPTTPYTRAPEPQPDTGFLNKISASGGMSAVARAFGVNSINDVSQTQLSGTQSQEASDNSVLKKYSEKLGFSGVNNVQDAAVLGLKLYGERKSLMGPTGIPGSLEGNFIGVRNQLGPVNIVGDLGSSAPSVFGSKSAKSSPLDKIMIR